VLTLRRSHERGAAQVGGWLDSHHTFSFSSYYDPRYMGFSHLRVINEDVIAPRGGFPTHGHQDMEIVTYILAGALEHRDSIGNGSVIRPGDVQRMTAGTGIRHSEYNASASESVHLLQIWILPDRAGLTPSYEQTYFAPEEKQNQLRLVGSADGREGSVTIHQDVNVYAGLLDRGVAIGYTNHADRQLWLHLAQGELQLEQQGGATHLLQAGDSVGVSQLEGLTLTGRSEQAEFLVFDLAAIHE